MELLRVCGSFVNSGYADPKFEAELTGESDGKFWSCVSEAMIYDQIIDKKFLPRSAVGYGPDFLLADGETRVWLEVICPEPMGLPLDWTEIEFGTVFSTPHEAILLRWTSAIKDKTDKLVGSGDGKIKGYLNAGCVEKDDVYVIVVNGCRLRHGPFSQLLGVSQFPYAVEAVFPVGPYKIIIDKNTLECVGDGYHERFHIPKPNGAAVPSYAFLDSRYNMVSAIWAVDFNGSSVIGGHEPSALVHNPNAVNRLRQGFLPTDEEFIATPFGDDSYEINRIKQSPTNRRRRA
jgi:hypothetical protein